MRLISAWVLSVLVLALLLAPLAGAASGDYWVVLGSFSKSSSIEPAKIRAGELGLSLTVMDVSTARGMMQRLMAGPFADRFAAQEVSSTARTQGFPDAWLVQSDVPSASAAGSSGTLDSSDTNDSASLPDAAPVSPKAPAVAPVPATSTSGISIDGERSTLLESLPPISTPAAPESDRQQQENTRDLLEATEDEVPGAAPEGYRLNRLRRDAQARPPPGTGTAPGSMQLDLNIGDPVSLTRLPHSANSIKIDGQLDEPVWRSLPVISDFHVTEPDTGADADLPTEVRVFYTEKGIYISFDLVQQKEQLVRWISSRDQVQLNRDHVGVMLDTSGEGLYGYWFMIALGDSVADGTVLPERRTTPNWDGVWYGRSAVTDKGWSAEYYLPWSQVAMPKHEGQRRMGLYVSRKLSSRDQRWAVPTLPPTAARFISAFRPIHLEGVDPKQQWSLFPYVASTQNEVEDGLTHKAGADVFWRPTTNFQLTATLNPDFGNVEADDVDVNLTAFETFFPEKRLFFVEGREIFETTPRSDTQRNREPTSVLNTRRIGGRPNPPRNVPVGVRVPTRELNQPVELTAALKATGQIGRLRYGILGATEDDVKFDIPGANLHQAGSDYGVARFLYEASHRGAYYGVGTISTAVVHPDADVFVHGIDTHFLSPNARWKLDSQLLYSDKDGVGNGAGGWADLVYTHRRGLSFSAGFDHYDSKLDINDLGFLRRNDATNARIGGNWTRVNLGWARQWAILPFSQFEINGDGDHTRRGFGFNNEILLPNLARLEAYLSYFPERDEDRESFGNGTFVTKGRHDTQFDYTSDTSKKLSYKVGFDVDGEISGGDTYKVRAGIIWRPLDRLSLDLLAEYWERGEWLLHQGGRNFSTFDSREWRPKLAFEYNFTARQQLRLAAQWIGVRAKARNFFLLQDGVERLAATTRPVNTRDGFSISNLNIQLRYRWEFAPLSDLFVVYTLGGARTLAEQPFDDLFDSILDEPDVEQLVVKVRYRIGS